MKSKSIYLFFITLIISSFVASVSQTQVIKVTTCEVLVPMKITNPDPSVNSSQLTAKDFTISSNGIEGVVASFSPIVNPYNIVLLMDLSDYADYKVSQMADTALAFVKTARQTRNKLGQARINKVALVVYGNKSVDALSFLTDNPDELALGFRKLNNEALYIVENSTNNPLQMKHDEVAAEVAALKKSTVADAQQGKSAMGLMGALKYVNNVLLSTRPAQENAIVILANPNTTTQYSTPNIIEQAQDSNGLIYTVQLTGKNETAAPDPKLKLLAETTGGSFYLGGTKNSFKKISDELSNRHFAGYSPPHPCNDGGRYDLKVEIKKDSKYAIHARSSYFANPEPTDSPGQNMNLTSEKVCHEGAAEIGDLSQGTSFISTGFEMPATAFAGAAEIATEVSFDTCELLKPYQKVTHLVHLPLGTELKMTKAWSSSQAFEADLVSGDHDYRLLCVFENHKGRAVSLDELQTKLKSHFDIKSTSDSCRKLAPNPL